MEKLSKTQVKAKIKRLKEGESLTIALYPSKCSPSNSVWVSGIEITVSNLEELERLSNSFAYYSCNNVLGKRVHYYLIQG
jgi:hypothetical protein